jgi:hypothetical protein
LAGHARGQRQQKRATAGPTKTLGKFFHEICDGDQFIPAFASGRVKLAPFKRHRFQLKVAVSNRSFAFYQDGDNSDAIMVSQRTMIENKT